MNYVQNILTHETSFKNKSAARFVEFSGRFKFSNLKSCKFSCQSGLEQDLQ